MNGIENASEVVPRGKLQLQLFSLYEKMGGRALKLLSTKELGKKLHTNSNNAGVARDRFFKVTMKRKKITKPVIAPESAAGRALGTLPMQQRLNAHEERFLALAQLIGVQRCNALLATLQASLEQAVRK